MPDSPADRGDSAAQALGAGDRLRSARKARAMSLERISEELNLDESVVTALEEERFEELGAPVFVRGHLRAYAKLVGLDPEIVLRDYQPAEPEEVNLPPVESVRNPVSVNPTLFAVSALVVCVAIALAVYVLQDDDPVVSAAADKPSPAAADTDASSAGPVRVAVPRPEPEAAPAIEASAIEEVAVSPEPATAEAVVGNEPISRPAAEGLRLSLQFREESWVEISDVNRRLIFGLQREGRRREVVGEPPIRVLLGNAAGVDMLVNEQPYQVPSSGVTGQVARFEIAADDFE